MKHLDPEAVEAARKAYDDVRDSQPRISCAQPHAQYMAEWVEHTTEATATAITTYIAHIEPKLRERVEALRWASIEFGTTEEGSISEERTLQRMSAELTNLYALFGLEAE